MSKTRQKDLKSISNPDVAESILVLRGTCKHPEEIEGDCTWCGRAVYNSYEAYVTPRGISLSR